MRIHKKGSWRGSNSEASELTDYSLHRFFPSIFKCLKNSLHKLSIKLKEQVLKNDHSQKKSGANFKNLTDKPERSWERRKSALLVRHKISMVRCFRRIMAFQTKNLVESHFPRQLGRTAPKI